VNRIDITGPAQPHKLSSRRVEWKYPPRQAPRYNPLLMPATDHDFLRAALIGYEQRLAEIYQQITELQRRTGQTAIRCLEFGLSPDILYGAATS
jgi:hypothetical protein